MHLLPKIALNCLLVLAAGSAALLRSTRGAHWGPEGPVGGWLLMIPPLFLMGGVLVAMVTMGGFDWVTGGRAASIVLLPGFLVAAATALWFPFEVPDNMWKSLAGAAPWAMLAGCLLVMNLDRLRGPLPKVLIAVTLGGTALAGWALALAGLVHYSKLQNQIQLSKVENEQSFQLNQSAEFRALGTDAPLWNYFSYMYMADESLRRQCRDIIAHRPDLNARLIEYLDNPVLADSVTRYIGDVDPNPSAALGPAYARFMDKRLQEYREFLTGQTALSDRARQDITELLTAAAKIQQAGADLKPHVALWRDFLRRFKNAADLERKADEIS